MVVLRAWRELQRIRREQMRVQELPVAQLAALLANVNRDPKKGKPFSINDFALFGERDKDEEFPADAAAIALELRRDGECPDALIGCWPAVLAAANQNVKLPSVRVLWSDDRSVVVLAPTWEGAHIRGTVVVSGAVSGPVVLRDRDRPLLTYTVTMPARPNFGYVSAGELLLSGS